VLLVKDKSPTKKGKYYEINDDTGCGFCRRPDDDHRLLDLLQKERGQRKTGDGLQWRMLQRSGDLREVLHGQRWLREVLQEVVIAIKLTAPDGISVPAFLFGFIEDGNLVSSGT
jgi:hypothetical protein